MATILKSTPQTLPEVSASREANPATGLARFNLCDLADEGRRQLDECRAMAAKIIEDAQNEAAALRVAAKKSGYEEGMREASKDTEQRIKSGAEECAKQQLQSIREAVSGMHAVHDQWMSEFAESLTAIAIAAAERIVRAKLGREKEIVVSWVEEAIRSTRTATHLSVALNPEMLAELGSTLDELVARPEFPQGTMIVPDESLDMTTVVVRQEGGYINIGLQAQLERLSEVLE